MKLFMGLSCFNVLIFVCLFNKIAGLTNNSHLEESHDVRHCVLKYRSLGKYVLDVAKKRLDDMLYVGLTENHRESATIFGDVVGAQVISQFKESKSRMSPVSNLSELNSSDLQSNSDTSRDSSPSNITYQGPRRARSVQARNGNMTVEKLMEMYESCITTLRKTQSQRRTNSLHHVHPANFSKEARLQIPEVLLQEVVSLNYLDVELYKYAQHIFSKQQKQRVPIVVAEDWVEKTTNKSYTPFWKVLYIALSILLLLIMLIYLLVNARRTTSKLKL